jgi:hypothetical protein
MKNATNTLHLIVTSCLALALQSSVSPRAQAYGEIITDPVGDFLPSYGFTQVGDLDVVRAQVIFTGTEFLFSGTMDAPIGTSPQAFYVWGVDRGVGAQTRSFERLGLPNIVFDLVVVAYPAGTLVVNDLDAGITTPLPPENISIDGKTIVAKVPLSLLPAKGLAPEEYRWNLWPRWDDGMGLSDPQISEFVPKDRTAGVSFVPSGPVGSFLASYGFPQVGDLDVVSAQVIFTGTDFLFSGTMDPPIGTSPEAFYVFGVDRGVGAQTRSFERLGLPNIVFDLVVVAYPAGALIVNDLDAGITTPLPPDNISIDGKTIVVKVPLSLLPGKGLAPEDYTWNLWPRWDDGMGLSDPQISQFVPTDRNATVSVLR